MEKPRNKHLLWSVNRRETKWSVNGVVVKEGKKQKKISFFFLYSSLQFYYFIFVAIKLTVISNEMGV